MATSYIGSTASASNGALFSLASGASRAFYTNPPLQSDESLELQVTPDSGTTWLNVGSLRIKGSSSPGMYIVTAKGGGSSDFRVNKTATNVATQVWYD